MAPVAIQPSPWIGDAPTTTRPSTHTSSGAAWSFILDKLRRGVRWARPRRALPGSPRPRRVAHLGKKRMIPAGVITRVDHDDRTVYVTLTKEQIKQAPDFEEARREQEAYRKELADHYLSTHTR